MYDQTKKLELSHSSRCHMHPFLVEPCTFQGSSSMWIALELVHNGNVIGRVKTGDNNYWNQGTNVVNAHLAAGDDVWVRHMTDSDSHHVVAQGGLYTAFAGHLIAAD